MRRTETVAESRGQGLGEWLARPEAEHDNLRAARLFGAAEGLREAMGALLPPVHRAEHDRSVAATRTALGEEAFAVAWAAGRALSPEQAVCTALAQPEIPIAGRQGSEESPGVTGPIR